METIGRFTVTVAVLVIAYIAIWMMFVAAGFSPNGNNPTYWFGFLIGSINLLIIRGIAR
jgi:hypothetical protein